MVQDIVSLESIPAERSTFKKLVRQKFGSDTSRLHGSGLRATLLPFKTVGVQGDGRTYSYPCVLSGSTPPDWPLLLEFARLIPKVCHNVNRVCYAFGGPAPGPYRGVTAQRSIAIRTFVTNDFMTGVPA